MGLLVGVRVALGGASAAFLALPSLAGLAAKHKEALATEASKHEPPPGAAAPLAGPRVDLLGKLACTTLANLAKGGWKGRKQVPNFFFFDSFPYSDGRRFAKPRRKT